MPKIILIVATAMLFSYKDVPRYIPFTVEGVVKDRGSGQPVKYVHVFTSKGEEEAVTDEKGAFHFESWKQTVVLTSEANGYQRTEVRLSLPTAKQTILLSKQ